MRVFTKVACSGVLLVACGAANAVTVLCPSALGVPVPGGDPATRQIQVSGALGGGECYYKQGNFQGDDFSAFLGSSYTLIEKDIAPVGGGAGILRYTGSVNGTWGMTPSQWPTYAEVFLAFHFGNGGGDPDSFIVELEPFTTSGNWTWIPTSETQALSNIYLIGRGTGTTSSSGGEVPEPGTIGLLGLGLLGLGFLRRAKRAA